MTALVVALGLVLLALAAGALVVPRQASWPATYALVPAEILGLTRAEDARLEAWSRDVEGLGFRRFGEYRAEIALGPGDGAWRLLQQLRAWRSADGRERAFVAHVVVLRPSGGISASSYLQLAFESRRQDGTFHSTHNCAPLEDRMLRPPGWTSTVAHGLEEAQALHALHRQARLESAVELGVDLPSDVAAVWAWKTGYALDRGLVRREGDRLRATARLGVLQALRILNPFVLESLPYRASMLRLGIAALLALGGAAAVGAPPAPAWTLPALFGATGLLLSAVLPASAFFAVAYALLPSEILLELRGHATGWAWTACVFATALGVTVRQRLRFRATALRMGRPPSGPPPLGAGARVAWGAAFAASLAATAGTAWLGRRPAGAWPEATALVALFGLGATLLFAITVLLSFKSELSRTAGFRTLKLASACLFLPVLGMVAGSMLEKGDRALTKARRAALVEALERCREVEGAYPARLEDLVPEYLPALPRAVVGWTESDFDYAPPVGGEAYRLGPP